MQARYYDPVIGRFLSVDPVGAFEHLSKGNLEGFNRYAYANNDPVNNIDAEGRQSNPVGILIGKWMNGDNLEGSVSAVQKSMEMHTSMANEMVMATNLGLYFDTAEVFIPIVNGEAEPAINKLSGMAAGEAASIIVEEIAAGKLGEAATEIIKLGVDKVASGLAEKATGVSPPSESSSLQPQPSTSGRSSGGMPDPGPGEMTVSMCGAGNGC